VSQFRSIYAAAVSAWWCCLDCDQARAYCPGCGEQGVAIDRPANHPPALPFGAAVRCPDPACGVVLTVTVCGYRPNPTGDAPANRSPLSDPLPVAERPRPQAPPPKPDRWPANLNRGRKPRPAPTGPQPCPLDAPRRRLAEWAAVGMLPQGIDPGTFASAFRLCFGGLEPRRDSIRKVTLAYSFRELGLTLGAMGLAPARQPAPGWEVQP
jgi:hypothetical protein